MYLTCVLVEISSIYIQIINKTICFKYHKTKDSISNGLGRVIENTQALHFYIIFLPPSLYSNTKKTQIYEFARGILFL